MTLQLPLALTASAALLLACPTNPAIDPTGKACQAGSDPCPVGFDCFDSSCVPVCEGGAPGTGDPSPSVLSPLECHCTSDCPAPQHCEPDPYWQGQGYFAVCAYACTTTGDCSDPDTLCANGFCRLNACSRLDSPCEADDAGDGTCLPFLAGGQGVCVQGGTRRAGTCSGSAQRGEPQAFCVVGEFCYADAGSFGTCATACDPQDVLNTPCGSATCLQIGPFLGICLDGG